MTHVGLTGGIGSGKSSVAGLLAERGAVIIDADSIAREVVEPDTDGLQAVADEFGSDVLAPDGSLDRQALAAQVFEHPVLLARLESIIHPQVRERRQQILSEVRQGAVVVEDIPLLVEKNMQDSFDVVVVVTAPEEVRVDRLVRLRGLDERDVRARMDLQVPEDIRLAAADVVIDNSGSEEQLVEQVDRLWERLRSIGSAD